MLASLHVQGQRVDFMPACSCGSAEAAAQNQKAVAAHLRRSLQEASDAYTRALAASPAREPSAAERDMALRFAPRVFTVNGDPFPLVDAAAVIHPDRPWIAYHFFWEDDIDFPDDNDPCDHELMWVRLDDDRRRVTGYFTYFHGRILEAPIAGIEDANQAGGRAAVLTQWGKHGTMPFHWRGLTITPDSGDVERKHLTVDRGTTLEAYNRATWEKLSTVGRQSQDSPLSRGWPLKFTGSFDDFTRFTQRVDPAELLRKKRYIAVSCLNNAVLNRRFLRYNFAAKTEWPSKLCVTQASAGRQASGTRPSSQRGYDTLP
jgi:hypothetical protein